jgi:hypothetical protein
MSAYLPYLDTESSSFHGHTASSGKPGQEAELFRKHFPAMGDYNVCDTRADGISYIKDHPM